MRRFTVFLSFIMVVGLALAACSPAPTQSTTGANATQPPVFVTTTANGVATLPAPGGASTESATSSAVTEAAATSVVTAAATTSPMTETVATSPAISTTEAAPASTAVSTAVVTSSAVVTSAAGTSAPSAAIPVLPGTGGDLVQASTLMSATVNDKNSQRVGSVQDLILNMVTRHVDYLMVRTDSAAHPTSAPDLVVTPAPNYSVVSWQAVAGISGNAVTLNVDAAAVSGAPVLETRAVPFLTPSDWKATFDSYWKKNLPASTSVTTATVTTPAAIPGGISGFLVASDILGQSLQTPNGQQIGSIKDFLVNVKTGEVAYVLVTSGPATQTAQKLIPVPVQLLGHNLESGAFTLPIPSSVLNQAPTIDLNNLPPSVTDWLNSLTTFWKTFVK